MDKFKEGDNVILQNLRHMPEFNGTDGVVVEILFDKNIHWSSGNVTFEKISYKVKWSSLVNGMLETCQRPEHLRKKRPKEKTGTWSDGNNAWIPKDLRIPTLTEVVK